MKGHQSQVDLPVIAKDNWKKEKKKETTSQFALKETQAVCQVPFSSSHRAPFDACKEPGNTIEDEMEGHQMAIMKSMPAIKSI